MTHDEAGLLYWLQTAAGASRVTVPGTCHVHNTGTLQ
jgi:hypothetical protein